ncbi:MAG: 50S ribosomal protein L29 [Xenococcaceae cyanobacterium MO_188.B32]|nr:50S ribosomal protein L29 [Xenococcaceae cyanobacterium MO_188.B32]
MALPSIEDARKLSDEELAEEIVKEKRQLFQLRLEQATRRLEKPHLFKHSKHRLSQLMTVERERQLAASQTRPASTTAAEEE